MTAESEKVKLFWNMYHYVLTSQRSTSAQFRASKLWDSSTSLTARSFTLVIMKFPHFDGQVLPILLKLDPDSLLNCGRASSRLYRLVSDWEVWAS